MALTDRTLKNAKSKTTVYRIRDISGDPELKGFGVTIAPAGSKTFFVGYTSPATSKRRQINLGRYPAVSLKDARQKARDIRASISIGKDPAETVVDTLDITLGAGLELYARAKLDYQRSGKTTERDLRRDFASLLELPAKTITTQMAASIIDSKARTAPTMANRLLGYSNPWFRWMKARGYIDRNPLENIEKPSKEAARERFLTPDELCAVWNKAPELGYPFGPFVQLLLLTGIRRNELAGMRRDELNFEEKLWRIPAARAKNAAAINIPLSEMAVSILNDIQDVGSPYVFTTTRKSPVSGFSRMKKKLDTLSGVTEWRLHDFRRTMVSTMVDFGIDAITADRCLNHTGAATMSTVQRVYQRSDLLDQRRNAVEQWGQYIKEISEE